MIRDFAAAQRFLSRTTDYERMASRYTRREYDLVRMRRLLAALGNPEKAVLCLHIAGTKGKGSTAHWTESMLRAAGHRTGLYTSPHLVDVRERIRVDGDPVGDAEFARAIAALEPACRRLRPTYFEILTAAAFRIFAERRVDWAVIEVGLGGRLDATNVILPAACAITTIDFDHMDKLGNTLAAIAGEKAGILKPGVPAVSSPQAPEAAAAIRARGPVETVCFRVLRSAGDGVHFRVEASRRSWTLPARGAHQAANAATALALVDASGARCPEAARRRGLARARLPARVEIVSRGPTTIVDAAHNPVSARALKEALKGLPSRRRVLVFGASEDKDTAAMLGTLAPLAWRTILTKAASPRAADPELLARQAGRRATLTMGSVAASLKLARKLAGPEGQVVVAGSFYVAGEALAAIRR
jgi:dihydrofolate synthase/folylpolyglutamate synthase